MERFSTTVTNGDHEKMGVPLTGTFAAPPVPSRP
jgi:hypothetical protein